MPEPDAVGRSGVPGRGNYMVLYLRLAGGTIQTATFQTYGCPGAIACGSVLTGLVAGKSLEQCCRIGREDVMGALDGLPLGKRHCADLAVNALRDALSQVGPQP